MDFVANNLLTLILFTPAVSAIVVGLLPGNEKKLIRWTAFILSLIPLILSVVMWRLWDSGNPGFQFEEQKVWYQAINSSYHLGVDGVSLTMVLLTTLLTPIAILASFTWPVLESKVSRSG
jgi:NADH-quinone oxidoreductase subunit M